MKITAFNGTNRSGISNTQVLIDSFLGGANEAGAEVRSFRLAEFDIRPCIACKSCWGKSDTSCVIEDDMAQLITAFVESDVVVFASPLYADNVTSLLKIFIDRLIPLCDSHWELDENGECRHARKFAQPQKMMVISNCGYPEQSHFVVLRSLFRRMERNMQMDLCGEIYRSAGALLTTPVPGFAAIVENYLDMVNQAGKEVVKLGGISPELMSRLDQPWVPGPDFKNNFIFQVNQLAKNKRPGDKK